jgi:hypothetical protein
MSSSHLTNPIGYRVGKTFLWSNNALLNTENKSLVSDINKAEGLEQVANQLLLKNNFIVVKSVSKVDQNTGSVNLNILYYPLFESVMRKNSQPTYLTRRSLLNKISVLKRKRTFRLLKGS